jgi:N utilization substance protein A
MNRELAKVAEELGREKKISKEKLSEALKDAIAAAVARKIGKYSEPEISVDLDKGEINILIPKEVSEEVDSNWHEIHIDERLKTDPNARLGDIVMVPVSFEEMGRQAALVAKQKLMERIKDAEKQAIYDDFQNKVGSILTGTVLKIDRDNVYLKITNTETEAVLLKREMIPGDYFNRGDYVRALLLEIKINRGMPQLVLSRTHPDFLKQLFEAEIPEVFDGTIEVKAVAREPGDRAKIAVYTLNSNIDPVGACIGMKGVRINSISHELRGERIDVIQWSPDPVKFVCNAISPAEVLLTNIFEDEKTFEIIVPDDQLSLAIGKKGQNVRLAAMLTGWKLDVLKESEYQLVRQERMQEQEQEMQDFYEIYNLSNLEALSEKEITTLIEKGIEDIELLSTASVDEIMDILQIDEDAAVELINVAIDYLTEKLDDLEEELLDDEEEE